jgi:N4-(beta-N-acetylglucosaminyl)-L-asparaginase
MNRRKFVKTIGTMAPLSMAASSELWAEGSVANSPVVISTWEPNTKANKAAWDVLQKKQSALDAVHAGVMIPEADPEDTSVGYGGLPDRDGKVTLDSCVMDHKGNIGAVMGLEEIMHASSVARMVMEKTPHVQLVGAGALQFALEQGFKRENLLTDKAKAAWQNWLKKSKYNPLDTFNSIEERIKQNHDTIGMLAMDYQGDISGMCTTSGLAFKMHGRVGDSSIIGAGLYVDNSIGAATATGVGEDVVRICGSHTVVEAMRYGQSPEEACKTALKRLVSLKGEEYAKKVQIGFIAMNKKGEYGCYSMIQNFTMAVHTSTGPTVIKAKSLFTI